jgi:Fic family protein
LRRIKRGAYIHERATWPGFRWDHERISARLVDVRHRQGLLIGRMEGLGFQLRAEAVLNSLTEEVLKSSEIEDETLDRSQVRSSIARRLGLDIGPDGVTESSSVRLEHLGNATKVSYAFALQSSEDSG